MNDRCAADQQCVALTSDGAAITNQPLCHGCVNHLQQRYDQLRGTSTIQVGFDDNRKPIESTIRAILPSFKGGMRGASGEARVSSGKREAPSPLDVHVVDVIDYVEELILDIGDLPISDVVRQEDGVARALRVTKLWRMADGIIGFAPRWERRFAPCWGCGLRTLGAYAGDEMVTCTSCGASKARGEYAKDCLIAGK